MHVIYYNLKQKENVFLAERQSDTESQTNEDSSDTNLAITGGTNHIDATLKNNTGKHSTNTFANGTQNQNGLDRSSPNRDPTKQKTFTNSAKKNNNKKARHR